MSVPAELIDRASRTDILETAQRFGELKRAGVRSREYFGPCPRCGGVDRFSVNTQKQVWNCRGCGKGGDVVSFLQHAAETTFAEAVMSLAGERWDPPKAPRTPDHLGGDDDHDRRQHEKAHWLWARRSPLAGSIGETYLREVRRYKGPLPATLGFLKTHQDHPPSLIAAFALADESEPGVLAAPKTVGSVLLIALKPDGSGKAEIEHPKKTIGSPAGLPVVVSPVNDLLGLAICEGLEDALSVYAATGLGAWAAGGAAFLPKLADAVPSYVECVTIFAHADEAGRRGAGALARSLSDKGVSVSVAGDANGR